MLKLRYSARDLIISILNQFSALLAGKVIDNEEKKRLIGDLNDLIFILTGLPLKSSDKALSNVMDKAKTIGNETNSRTQPDVNEPILDLPALTRIKIIEHLIKNQNFAILHLDTIKDRTKNNIKNENKNLIKELMDLNESNGKNSDPGRIVDLITIEDSDDEIMNNQNDEIMNNQNDEIMNNQNDEIMNNQNDEIMNNQMECEYNENTVNGENSVEEDSQEDHQTKQTKAELISTDDFDYHLINLKSDLHNEMTENKNELKHDIFDLNERIDNLDSLVDDYDEDVREEIDNLKKEIENLKELLNEKIKHVDIFRSDLVYKFKFDNVKKFFESSGKYLSEYFYCQGIPFCVGLKVTEYFTDQEIANKSAKYLGLYLNCMNNSDYTEWKVTTDFELRIINLKDPKANITKSFNCIFNSSDSATFGRSKFIKFENLTNPANGFIYDDSIKLEVYLKASKVIRSKE